MTASLILQSLVTFITIISIGFPYSAFAAIQETAGQATIFEINSTQKDTVVETSKFLRFNEIVAQDPLVDKLKTYLEKHKSPLAQYAEEIIQQPQWQRALAISWVESNFGRRCADNNCSGIGVAPGHPSWRKYETKLAWFKDMCKLLETPRYKEKYTTFEKMRGIYVYPGSDSWVKGAKQKYADLIGITEDAEEETIGIIPVVASVDSKIVVLNQ
jgi:hypothetical protein